MKAQIKIILELFLFWPLRSDRENILVEAQLGRKDKSDYSML